MLPWTGSSYAGVAVAGAGDVNGDGLDDIVIGAPDWFEDKYLVSRYFNDGDSYVVFGSRANGTAGPDSDIDLMVEMTTDLKPLDRTRAIDALFGIRDWAMDVVVYTPEEVERREDCVGTLLYTIAREGNVLYGDR